MNLHLVDVNSELVAAWEAAFADDSDVSVHHGDILAIAENTVVSAANSHGFMDGGIDAQYSEFFGAALQRKVQQQIERRPEGMLPVGATNELRGGLFATPEKGKKWLSRTRFQINEDAGIIVRKTAVTAAFNEYESAIKRK